MTLPAPCSAAPVASLLATHKRGLAARAALVAATALAAGTSARAQILENKLLAFDGSQADELGLSVAMSPGWAFCGAPGEDAVASDSGAVYAFTNPGTGTGWSFAQKLKASTPRAGAAHGFAVAAS